MKTRYSGHNKITKANI